MLTSATREEMLTTREEGQLPKPNEWNSTITSATREEMLTLVRIAKKRSAYRCRTNSHSVFKNCQQILGEYSEHYHVCHMMHYLLTRLLVWYLLFINRMQGLYCEILSLRL